MSELTASEQYERGRRSIQVAEERLAVINQRLPALETELEELIVTNEIKGYKGRTIEKTQAEIESLQKEKVVLGKTVEVLKKKLPELETAARVESAATEGVVTYQKAHGELTEILNAIPSLDTLTTGIETLREFLKEFDRGKRKYLSLSRGLADIMVSEKLESLGDITLDSLRSDRSGLDYVPVLQLSDSLIDLNERIKRLQYDLFIAATNNPLEFYLPPEPKPEPQFSEDGRFKIERLTENRWEGFVKETFFADGKPFDTWKQILGRDNPITFEELKRIAADRIQEGKRAAMERLKPRPLAEHSLDSRESLEVS